MLAKLKRGLVLAAFAWVVAPVPTQTFDTIVRHGRIIDGTGNPAYFADLAIANGRIAAIGKIMGKAKVEIDAAGQVVAPGFIDVHTHADDVAKFPLAENFIQMGVTTIIAGNCGSSAKNIAELFSEIEHVHVSPNFATLIGQGTVRAEAMGGSFDRPPTAREMTAMKGTVEQGMKDGAVGMSTGLIYLPGTFTKTDEIVELTKVLAPYNGIYTSHMRDEGAKILDSLNEVFRIAREAGVRAEVSHIKLSSNDAWGRTAEVLAAIEHARAEGLEITQDEYAYTASSTGISQLIPDSAREGGRQKFLARVGNAETKAGIVAEMRASLEHHQRKDFAYAVIAEYKHDPALDGMNIPAAAKARRGSESVADQIELILDIESHGGAQGVFHGINEDDLQVFMRHPNTMIACDSGVREFGKGVPHPRGYGNNARVLARYVRELGVLRLEDAIRRMTSLPAQTFHFKDRGQLRAGDWADVVIFDPATIQDHATYEDPHHYPTGIQYVLVNGVVVLKDGKHTGATPGMVLRNQPVAN